MARSTVVPFDLPSEFSPDPLTEVIRAGARELLRTAVQAEVPAFISEHGHLLDDAGRQRLVRHGFLPEREGDDRDRHGSGFAHRWFHRICAKRSRSRSCCQGLYLKGIPTGDFSEALAALPGPDAQGLSSSADHAAQGRLVGGIRDLAQARSQGKRYVCIRADGVCFTPRPDDDCQCMLVIIGADEYGEKDVLAIMDRFRENADSWHDLLKGLKKRGLTAAPEFGIGDGALGFRTALRDVYPETREQRCWLHKVNNVKVNNVLGAMPTSIRDRTKPDLQDIWVAETKKETNAAFDLFVETYGVKYEKAVAKLVKDRDELLAFYDVPAEH